MKINTYFISKSSYNLCNLTKITQEKWPTYFCWIAQQDPRLLILVFLEHTNRYQPIMQKCQKKKEYNPSYKCIKRLIRLIAAIEVIALYYKADGNNDIDTTDFWFADDDIQEAKTNLQKLRGIK